MCSRGFISSPALRGYESSATNFPPLNVTRDLGKSRYSKTQGDLGKSRYGFHSAVDGAAGVVSSRLAMP